MCLGKSHRPIERADEFSLAIQPIVAAALAVRSGLTDAREGRPPFFWATRTQAAHRPDLVRQGWTDAGKVFVLAVVLDAIDHLIVWRVVYARELLIVATALAIVPYILIRSPSVALQRLSRSTGSEKQSSPIVEENLQGEQYDRR